MYVNRPLDRERVPEYRLTVTVKDNPENIRNARRVITDTAGTSGGADGRAAGKRGSCHGQKQAGPLSTVSDGSPIPRMCLGITGRGLQPHPQQRAGPVRSRAGPKSFVDSMQQQEMSWKVRQYWARELENHNDSGASFG